MKKKSVKKKKAFTMVELLATVTILGILMVVSIGSISLLMKKGKTNYYSTQRKNLISAAKSYYNNNKQMLPKNVGSQDSVTLSTLISQKYIGKVYDSNKNECMGDTTIVVVTLESKGKYTYKSYLDCPGIPKETPENDPAADDSQFEYQVQTVTAGKTYNVLIKSKNTLKIISYEYSVLKNGYVEQKASGTANDTTVTTKNFTINEASNIKTNVYTVVLKIVDEKHQTHTGTVTLQLGDSTNPTCGAKETKPNRWVKSNQSISVACSDKDDLNLPLTCQHDVFKVLLRDDKDLLNYLKPIGGTNKPAITIIDRMGNTTNCDISDDIQIDSTAPGLNVIAKKWTGSTPPTSPDGLSAYSWGAWTNTNVFTQATSIDDPPTGLEMIATSNNVKIAYSTSGQVGTQTNKTPTYTNNSSHKKVGYVNITTEGKSTITYNTEDKIQNKRSGTKSNIWIDKTKPNKPTVTLKKWKNNSTKPTSNSGLTDYSNNTWSKVKVYVSATATDPKPSNGGEQSGVDHLEYTITGKEPNVSNKSGSSVSIVTEGTSKIKFRAVDKAGNIGDWSDEYTIKLDWTAPTGMKVGLYKWKNVNTEPSSSAGLSAYTNATWINGKVFTMAYNASEPTDAVGGIYYQYTTTGKTTNNSNKKGPSVTNQNAAYRNIAAEGTSYIKWRACDKLDNCSAYTGNYTINLDRSDPSCSIKKTVTDDPGGVDIKVTCSDSVSSVTDCPGKQYNLKDDKTYTVHDKASNSGSCTVKVSSTKKYRKKTKSCTTKYKNCQWTGGNNPSNYHVGECARKKCTTSNRGALCSSPNATYGWTCICDSYQDCKWSGWSGYSTSNHCPGYSNSSTCKQESKLYYS